MHPEQYPPQEPLAEFARPYHDRVLQLAAKISGVEIQHGADPYQSLVYFPAPRPDGNVVIMIHGGGWTNGYKEWMSFKSVPLNSAGITMVSLGYRLAPMHLFPAGLDDCMSGVAWVRKNIDKLGGDPARIFIGGHSAGGHYASLLAVRRDWQKSYGVEEDVIRGCLPVSGAFRFGPGSGLSVRPRFLGNESNETIASPVTNISATPPPFLISYGSDDFPHLREQAREMGRVLSSRGGIVELLELPDCDHLGASLACGAGNGLWIKKVCRWLRTV